MNTSTNPSTNTPAITSGVGAKGDFYIVEVAGSTVIDGLSPWAIEDKIIFDGFAWRRQPTELASALVEKYIDRIVIPGIGDVDYAAVSTDGRVYSASRVDGRAWAGWEAGLFEPERVVDRIVVPGVGDVVFAAVSPDGRVYSASRVDGRAWTGWESGLFEPERIVDRIVIPGIGDVAFAAVSPDGRVYSASHVDGRAWAGWEAGLFEPERFVDRIVVPGIGDVAFANVDQVGRVYSATSRGGGFTYNSTVDGLTRAAAGAEIYDVVIYGAAPAGIMAAMRAAQRGLTICVVEPLSEIGGVIAGGLTVTDFPQYGYSNKLGGLTAGFFRRMATEYGTTGLKQSFEAKVAARVFNEYLVGTGARIVTVSPIYGPSDVLVLSGRIEAIRTSIGWVRGRTWIDASYEGDLYAHAGAPYHVGREAEAEFGEAFAGFRTSWGYTQTGVSPNNLYPVQTNPGTPEGDADALVQPYSYRLPVTTASDRLPFPVPIGGYDASMMDQFVEMINDRGDISTFNGVIAVESAGAVPNGKWCINALRLLSIELPGAQHEYPNASWSQRRDIIAEHKRWQMHVFYMLQNDVRLSSGLRTNSALYGLCADEWTHNETRGWPDQLYIREARRLRGAYIMTQYDLYDADNVQNTDGARNSSKADTICKFAYFLDAHSMALYAEGDSTIRATGNSPFGLHDSDLYDVPFSALHTTPGSGHIQNLVVSTCFSATSVAWRSMRMEPVFMMAGEAAGEACALMRETGQSVDQLDVSTIQARLVAQGSII